MPHFITMHDGSEPYKSLAANLEKSIWQAGAGICHVVECPPNGGDMYSELMLAAYPVFSRCVNEDVTIIIDADCIVMRPLEDLANENFVVACVNRGKCSNSMGKQDCIAHFVAFSNRQPEAARQFYIHWCIETMRLAMTGEDVSTAIGKAEKLRARGWTGAKWYVDQSALNHLIDLFNGEGVLYLPRGKYDARCQGGEALIVHAKGGNKIQ